jgi:hypothetical protein
MLGRWERKKVFESVNCMLGGFLTLAKKFY